MAHSQLSLIVDHFRAGHSISQVEAQAVYGIARLASRIDELRQMGWPIVTTMKHDRAGKRYARYSCQTDGMKLPASLQPPRLAAKAEAK